MPEQDAELFEVGFSEFGQCLKVDGIGAKDRLVFGQRKFSQPIADIHGVIPPGHRHPRPPAGDCPPIDTPGQFDANLLMISEDEAASAGIRGDWPRTWRSDCAARGLLSILGQYVRPRMQRAERPSMSRRSGSDAIAGGPELLAKPG